MTAGATDTEPAPAMSWALTSEQPVPPGPNRTWSRASVTLFTDRVTALGATVKESPGPQGNRLTITFPGRAPGSGRSNRRC